ncbi:3-hydroxyacyl-CoA dehydrogenase NAD-binding domain-containing protein [Pontibacillus litoralis]|uniref:UDP-glucose/GDP-mannose dehydrogenase N-terminal domain-containing protein n=1 Tax=Pontibacillus litoralis JSM 072002 TaxID=1385512 RepID=A0A0A5HR77_9BACI|nr:3-hydroxyacyl-CoA dehydrogenase NAD-binding domain-containing protein [Pontibacillus litoralis]KGX86132.1 hypothetical protein N784_06090 [Pontibacillus litoralis JSM 072002]
MKNIAVVGAGYVGVVTAASLANMGHYVVCIDKEESVISKWREGTAPYAEPRLQQLLEHNKLEGRLTFTSHYAWGVRNMDVVFLTSDSFGAKGEAVDLAHVQRLASNIAEHLIRDVVVVNRSAVPIGTNVALQRFLTNYNKGNVVVDVVYNPSFPADLKGVEQMYQGNRIVLGGNNREALLFVEELYRRMKLSILKTDFSSAELIKYASDTFTTLNNQVLQEILLLCEQVGANKDDVVIGIHRSMHSISL